MKKLPGKIILLDDQEYERLLLEEALLRKQWEVTIEYFPKANDALSYLRETQDPIFLIICDINMPRMDGLEFKKVVDQDPKLSEKGIPFVFVSTAATREQVQKAYSYRVQGYFQKPATIEKQADMLDVIIHYWIINQHPRIYSVSTE